MRQQKPVSLKPQDLLVLLKLTVLGDDADWTQVQLAQTLRLSQSEISQSLARAAFAGLFSTTLRRVHKPALLELLLYGAGYVFPVRPGALVRGIPTAHSAPPLNAVIQSEVPYVWPYAQGTIRGQAISPLAPGVPEACLEDAALHELLALVDAIRVGKAREQALARQLLTKQLADVA
jgi:hypothetical protein